MFEATKRTLVEDQRFTGGQTDTQLSNHRLVRVSAMRLTFTRVDFRYCIFDGCYFRNCTFDSCDFTGCRFVGSNLRGSKFAGSRFDYASFERTDVDPEILDDSCPERENLKERFARSLRINFAQLGVVDGVHKAVAVELDATAIHLRKAWKSNESYFRRKYRGWARVTALGRWLNFWILHFLWGNGESPWKMFRSLGLVLGVMVFVDKLFFRSGDATTWYQAACDAPQVLLGVAPDLGLPGEYLALVTITRLVALGFLISMLIKRFNWR